MPNDLPIEPNPDERAHDPQPIDPEKAWDDAEVQDLENELLELSLDGSPEDSANPIAPAPLAAETPADVHSIELDSTEAASAGSAEEPTVLRMAGAEEHAPLSMAGAEEHASPDVASSAQDPLESGPVDPLELAPELAPQATDNAPVEEASFGPAPEPKAPLGPPPGVAIAAAAAAPAASAAQDEASAKPKGKRPTKAKRRTSGSLTIPEMLRLMRLEFDKAQRFQYPIVGLIFTADGLDEITGPEGARLRRRVMPAVFNLLKKVTVAQNIQGLGSWTGNRQLALFPHVAPWNIEALTETLLERARNLPTPEGIPPLRLSIGVAHNQHSQATTFDALLEEAEKGLTMAMQAGGDRCVQFREVEEEAAALRDEVQQQMENLAGAQEAHASEEADFSDRLNELTKAVRDKFERYERNDPELERLEHEVVGLIRREFQRGHSGEMRAYKQQIDLMERRMAKLNAVLATTESELQRVAAMKMVDDGIASMYQGVQGLSDDESQSELKHEMMACIFQANLELQQQHRRKEQSCAEEAA